MQARDAGDELDDLVEFITNEDLFHKAIIIFTFRGTSLGGNHQH